jgi:hypothetical protein
MTTVLPPIETIEEEPLARRMSDLVAAAADSWREPGGPQATRDALLDLFADAEARGELGPFDPDLVCRLCLILIDGLAAREPFQRPRQTVEHLLEPLVWGLLDRVKF